MHIIYLQMTSTFHLNPVRFLGYVCLNAIRDRMAENYLELNSDMTEVLVVGPEKVAPMTLQNIGPLSSTAHASLCNSGVISDQSADQILFVSHLRNISKLRSVVSTAELEIIHALISSYTDRCNTLFSLFILFCLVHRWHWDDCTYIYFSPAWLLQLHFHLPWHKICTLVRRSPKMLLPSFWPSPTKGLMLMKPILMYYSGSSSVSESRSRFL